MNAVPDSGHVPLAVDRNGELHDTQDIEAFLRQACDHDALRVTSGELELQRPGRSCVLCFPKQSRRCLFTAGPEMDREGGISEEGGPCPR